MKKFNFRLTGYLRIKEFEEKTAWNEVLKQEARTSQIKNKIDNLIMSIHTNREGLTQTGGGETPDVARWQLINESITGMNAQIGLLQQEYAVEAKILERLVNKHRDLKRESKVIENYKDRKRVEFKEEKQKQADQQRQDFSMQSHIRKAKDT